MEKGVIDDCGKKQKDKEKCLHGTNLPVGTHFEEEDMWVEWGLAKRIILICLSSGTEKKVRGILLGMVSDEK